MAGQRTKSLSDSWAGIQSDMHAHNLVILKYVVQFSCLKSLECFLFSSAISVFNNIMSIKGTVLSKMKILSLLVLYRHILSLFMRIDFISMSESNLLFHRYCTVLLNAQVWSEVFCLISIIVQNCFIKFFNIYLLLIIIFFSSIVSYFHKKQINHIYHVFCKIMPIPMEAHFCHGIKKIEMVFATFF